MKKLLALATVGILVLSLLISPVQRKANAQLQVEVLPGDDAKFYRSENPVTDQYVVMLTADFDVAKDSQPAYDLAANYRGTILAVPYLEGFNGFSISMKEEYAIELSRDPTVLYVEEMPVGGLEEAPTPQLEQDIQIPDPEPDLEAVIEIPGIIPGPVPVGDTINGGPTQNPPSVGDLITPLPVSSEILKRAPAPNDRYFLYGNKIVQLFGMSGSYLPHVKRSRARSNGFDPVLENCTGDAVAAGADGAKYQKCIKMLGDNGLNHFQIWVALNHSVGMLPIELGTGPMAISHMLTNSHSPERMASGTFSLRWIMNSLLT